MTFAVLYRLLPCRGSFKSHPARSPVPVQPCRSIPRQNDWELVLGVAPAERHHYEVHRIHAHCARRRLLALRRHGAARRPKPAPRPELISRLPQNATWRHHRADSRPDQAMKPYGSNGYTPLLRPVLLYRTTRGSPAASF